jgi:5'(3')-deoxyribonucleotidase
MGVRILLDMDGVLVDFLNTLKEIFPEVDPEWPPKEWDVHKLFGVSENDMWDRVHALGDSFWADMPTYDWMEQLLDMVSELSDEWYISTSPSNHPSCVSGKLRWLQDAFGERFGNYFLGRNKFVLANSKAILIDDNDDNVNDFREAGGKAILFPQPWNSNRDRIDSDAIYGGRLHYVRDRLEKALVEIRIPKIRWD